MAAVGFWLLAARVSAGEPSSLVTQKDKVNYAIGVNLIGNFKHQGIDIDLDLVIKGMKDASSGGKLLLSDEELRKAINMYQTEVRKIHEKKRTKGAPVKKNTGGSAVDGK